MQLTTTQAKKLSSRSIVGLYFAKVKSLTGVDFKPKSNEWSSFCGRVNSFKERENISWENYLQFVELIFSHLVPKNYEPVFGMICSSKVYEVVKCYVGHDSKKVMYNISENTFKDLQKELYEGRYFHVLQNH